MNRITVLAGGLILVGALACCGSQWADMDTSCATAKADCTEKCEVEKTETQTIGPACAFEAVNYVEDHRDALAGETDPQLVHLRVQTYAACSHGSARACTAHRAVVAAITSKANGTATSASQGALPTAPAATAAATTSPASPPPPQPATAPGAITGKHGETITVKNDTEVTVTAASGALLASCTCGQPTPYHEAVAFMAQVQDLVAKGDWQGLSAVMNFPARTPAGPVTSAAAFVAKASAIFTAAVRAAIADAEPKAVFCNAQGFMIGDGVLWANADASGHVGVVTVNKPLPVR